VFRPSRRDDCSYNKHYLNSFQATILCSTSRWYLFEFKRTIADMRTLPASVQKNISLFVLARMDMVLRVKRAPGMPGFVDSLTHVLTEAHDLRHLAVRRGANSGNAAGLLESWAGGLLGAIKYRISKNVSEKIDAALIKFVADNLTEQEIKSVTEKPF
jgi:hypothetical protein